MESDKIVVLTKLLTQEHIFQWKPSISEEYHQEFNFDHYEAENFDIFKFGTQLVLCYKHYLKGELQEALEVVKNFEQECHQLNLESTETILYRKIEEAVKHILLASKSFLLLKLKQNVDDIVEKIKPVKEMNPSNRSAINGIKSFIYLCSFENSQEAVGLIDKAILLDPDNAYWIFIKGLLLQKIRKMKNPIDAPHLEEKDLFKKAFDSDPNPLFMVYLADIYRQTAAHGLKRQKIFEHFGTINNLKTNLLNNVKEKLMQASSYYKKAAELKPNSLFITFDCAEGLLRLPHPFKDVTLAKNLMKIGLGKDPNHVLGNRAMALCAEVDTNMAKAKEHLNICQENYDFGSDMNMLRIEYKENPNSDIPQEFEKLLEKYKELPRKATIFSQMVSYYMFVKYDLKKCYEYVMKFYSFYKISNCMELHQSCFIFTPEPFSLIEVLLDEVNFVLWNKKTSFEMKELSQKFYHFMSFQNVKIPNKYSKNLRQRILQGQDVNSSFKGKGRGKPKQDFAANENFPKKNFKPLNINKTKPVNLDKKDQNPSKVCNNPTKNVQQFITNQKNMEKSVERFFQNCTPPPLMEVKTNLNFPKSEFAQNLKLSKNVSSDPDLDKFEKLFKKCLDHFKNEGEKITDMDKFSQLMLEKLSIGGKKDERKDDSEFDSHDSGKRRHRYRKDRRRDSSVSEDYSEYDDRRKRSRSKSTKRRRSKDRKSRRKYHDSSSRERYSKRRPSRERRRHDSVSQSSDYEDVKKSNRRRGLKSSSNSSRSSESGSYYRRSRTSEKERTRRGSRSSSYERENTRKKYRLRKKNYEKHDSRRHDSPSRENIKNMRNYSEKQDSRSSSIDRESIQVKNQRKSEANKRNEKVLEVDLKYEKITKKRNPFLEFDVTQSNNKLLYSRNLNFSIDDFTFKGRDQEENDSLSLRSWNGQKNSDHRNADEKYDRVAEYVLKHSKPNELESAVIENSKEIPDSRRGRIRRESVKSEFSCISQSRGKSKARKSRSPSLDRVNMESQRLQKQLDLSSLERFYRRGDSPELESVRSKIDCLRELRIKCSRSPAPNRGSVRSQRWRTQPSPSPSEHYSKRGASPEQKSIRNQRDRTPESKKCTKRDSRSCSSSEHRSRKGDDHGQRSVRSERDLTSKGRKKTARRDSRSPSYSEHYSRRGGSPGRESFRGKRDRIPERPEKYSGHDSRSPSLDRRSMRSRQRLRTDSRSPK